MIFKFNVCCPETLKLIMIWYCILFIIQVSSYVSTFKYGFPATYLKFKKLTLISQAKESNEIEENQLLWFRKGIRNNLQREVSIEQNSTRIRELPIFPFDFGQCFPTGMMPLNIFVMKYRQMMNDILETDRMFGITMSDSAGGLCLVGTMMESTQRKLLADGRQFSLNEARNRFKIIEIVKEEPYTVAKVQLDLFDSDAPPEELLSLALVDLEREVWQCLQDVVSLNRKLGHTVQLSQEVLSLAPLASPRAGAASTAFSFAVGEMLDLAGGARQLLLQGTSLSLRLGALRGHLHDIRGALLDSISVNTHLKEPFN
jgi:ATP-dependent Lon protease